MPDSPFSVKSNDDLPPGMIGLPSWMLPTGGQPSPTVGVTQNPAPTPTPQPAAAPAPAAPPPLPGSAELARLTQRSPASMLPGGGYDITKDQSQPGDRQIHNPFLRTAATIGDALLSTFAPRAAAVIPGNATHHAALVSNAENAVASQENEREEARKAAAAPAAVADTESQTALRNAQAQKALNGEDKEQDPEKDAYKYYTSPAGGSLNPADAYAKILAVKAGSGLPKDEKIAPEVEAYKSLIAQGKSPEDAYAAVKQLGQTDKPDTGAQDDQKYEGIIAKQLQGQKLTPEETAAKGAYEKRKTLGAVTTNVFAGQREDRKEANTSDKETETAKGKLKDTFRKEFSGVQSQLDSIQDARNELASNPVGQSLGTIKTIVAVAGGKGSGVRITQPELNSIVKDLGIKETFENWVSNISGQGKMAPATLAQVNAVLSAVEKKALEKEQRLNGTLDQIDSAKNKEDLNRIEHDYRQETMHGGAGNAPRVTGKDDPAYQKLPSGAEYIGPDGARAKKK